MKVPFGPDNKKKFILALNDSALAASLTDRIRTHIKNAHVVSSIDGSDALMRITNDPPHVLILDMQLPKMSGENVAEALLKDKNFKDVAIIFNSEIPDDADLFIDSVTVGQVHFFNEFQIDAKFAKILARALNFSFRGQKTAFQLRFLTPGEQLLRQGDQPDNVYIVRKGSLKATVLKDGQTVEIGQVLEGEFVGEMAYINHVPRTADVTAATDCELIVIPIDHLDHLLFQKPAWSKALLQTLSRRLQQTNARLS